MINLTIIMPSYNQVSYIEKAILSVLDQDYKSVELIIADGGSTDGTLDIIRKYECEKVVLIEGPDRGQTHALNRAYELAKGDIIGWQNSDDFYLEDIFSFVADTFEQYNCDFLYGNHVSVDSRGRTLRRHRSIPLDVNIKLYENTIIYNQSLFWRKKASDKLIIERFGGPFNEEFRFTMDSEFISRAILSGAVFGYVNRFIGAFRYHDTSKTATMHDVFVREYNILRKQLFNDYDPQKEWYLRLLYKVKRYFLIMIYRGRSKIIMRQITK